MSSLIIEVPVNVAESVCRGKATSGTECVTVTDADLAALSAEERAVLAAALNNHAVSRRGQDAGASHRFTAGSVPEGTLPGMLEALRLHIAEQEAKKEQAEADAASVRSKALAVLAERQTQTTTQYDEVCGYSVPQHLPAWPAATPDDIRTAPEAVAWTAELKAQYQAALTARRAEIQAASAAEAALEAQRQLDYKARAAAGREKLAAWVRDHGSDLCRARLEDGFSWKALAAKEYTSATIVALGIDLPNAETPDGYEDGTASDREAPTLAEILLLRDLDAKIAAADLDATAEIRWVTYCPETDEDYDDEDEPRETISRAELVVTVTAPNGTSNERSFDVEQLAKQPA